jgi:hypothetical protein
LCLFFFMSVLSTVGWFRFFYSLYKQRTLLGGRLDGTSLYMLLAAVCLAWLFARFACALPAPARTLPACYTTTTFWTAGLLVSSWRRITIHTRCRRVCNNLRLHLAQSSLSATCITVSCCCARWPPARHAGIMAK